jgi:hypothetical protein
MRSIIILTKMINKKFGKNGGKLVREKKVEKKVKVIQLTCGSKSKKNKSLRNKLDKNLKQI